MERLKEILAMPANYMKFVFSRFPERKTAIIITGALTLICLLIWIFSGLKWLGIAFGIALAVFVILMNF